MSMLKISPEEAAWWNKPPKGLRTESVWVASRDGDERRYASPIPFAEWFLKSLHRQGFRVLRVDYPVEDHADRVVKTSVTRGMRPAEPEEHGKSKSSRGKQRGRGRGRPHQAGAPGRGHAR